jgi:hypothetical protein
MTPQSPLPLSGQLAQALESARAIAAAEGATAVRFEHFLLAALFHTYPQHIDHILQAAAAMRDLWLKESAN